MKIIIKVLLLILVISLLFITTNKLIRENHIQDIQKVKAKDIKCLTENIYHEARGEDKEGWLAVANVVKNRINNPNFPKDVCSVVYQPNQFSWVGIMNEIKDRALYKEIEKFVIVFLSMTHVEDNTKGAICYHTTSLKELWKDKTVKIGNHIFFETCKVLKRKS